jgi:hypothetical protein
VEAERRDAAFTEISLAVGVPTEIIMLTGFAVGRACFRLTHIPEPRGALVNGKQS